MVTIMTKIMKNIWKNIQSYSSDNKISRILKPRIRENSRCVTVNHKDDVWPAFREMLGAVKEKT